MCRGIGGICIWLAISVMRESRKFGEFLHGNVVGDFQAILASVLIGIMDECGRMKDLADYYSVICV